MKPTLDEEITEIAEQCATDYTEMTDFSSLPECIKSAIRICRLDERLLRRIQADPPNK